MGPYIIAVSDYSNYPESAKNLPRVASYQGANIAEILRLQPTHILAWEGGNKISDIATLMQLKEKRDLNIYLSQVKSISDLLTEIEEIGKFLNVPKNADVLIDDLQKSLDQQQRGLVSTAFYYMGMQPLYGLGSDPWLNALLSVCNIQNLNGKIAASYSPLSVASVIRQQPDFLIFADKLTISQHETFWEKHRPFLKARLIKVNPDAMHRFTPRAIHETIKLCNSIRQR